jgi:hypothetical protein
MENQALTVQSNVVLTIERTWAYSITVTRKVVQCTFERTPIVFESTRIDCYIVACLRSNVLPALERTSTSSINIPEAVCLVFKFLLF